MKTFNCTEIKKIREIRLPLGVRWTKAMEFAEQSMWIKRNADVIAYTEFGNQVVDEFNGHSVSIYMWRRILRQYILACKPAWAHLIPSGRRQTYFMLSNEEKRCFIEANLMGEPDDETVDWWDNMATQMRINTDQRKSEAGRKGERLTLKFEERRTGLKPIWRSIESNLDGFDVESVVSPNNYETLRIEVKSSTIKFDYSNLFLTRNEWEHAQDNNAIGPYMFYLWDMSDANPRLATVNIEEMSKHIPCERGMGKWQDVKIPFSEFESMFSVIDNE